MPRPWATRYHQTRPLIRPPHERVLNSGSDDMETVCDIVRELALWVHESAYTEATQPESGRHHTGEIMGTSGLIPNNASPPGVKISIGSVSTASALGDEVGVARRMGDPPTVHSSDASLGTTWLSGCVLPHPTAPRALDNWIFCRSGSVAAWWQRSGDN
jgi:hypothetical protein